MADINVSELLEKISEEAPSGDDLEYDPEYLELVDLARGRPEQQYGDTIIEAEGPDWKLVRPVCLKLLARTKDLRVACHLAQAALFTDGIQGFEQGLQVISGYVDQYWDNVHPQLDPDDDNDPTMRVNVLASLNSEQPTLSMVRSAPLVDSRMLGRISWNDIAVAKGETPASDEATALDMNAVEAAFMNMEFESLQQSADGVKATIRHLDAIEEAVARHVGAANGVNLETLKKTLSHISDFLAQYLSRRSSETPVDDAPPAADLNDVSDAGNAQVVEPVRRPQALTEITSRDDAIRALDLVCRYFEQYEPSSPLPILVRRAKQLASKSFIDIIKNLTPSALSEAEALAGPDGRLDDLSSADQGSASGD